VETGSTPGWCIRVLVLVSGFFFEMNQFNSHLEFTLGLVLTETRGTYSCEDKELLATCLNNNFEIEHRLSREELRLTQGAQRKRNAPVVSGTQRLTV
jgi:hypothetical protein